jgi:quinol monooxygenase YgiN
MAMSTFVVLECQAKPDKVDEVKNFLRKVLPDTRAYEGFESLVVHQSQEDPTSLMMYEQWSTRPNYEAYLAWRTETGALDEFVAMLAGPPSFRFFDLVDA